MTEFRLRVYVCICLADDNLLEVRTCRTGISDKLLFLILQFVWIKYSINNPLHRIWIKLKLLVLIHVYCMYVCIHFEMKPIFVVVFYVRILSLHVALFLYCPKFTYRFLFVYVGDAGFVCFLSVNHTRLMRSIGFRH